MKYTITTKKFDLTDKEVGHIVEKHIKRIDRLFPKMQKDTAEMDILVRRNHQRKELGRFEIDDIDGEYIEFTAPKLSKPFYYDGTLKFTLPKKVLVVHFYGVDLIETINSGFSKLFREIDTYKGKHYKGDSEYFNHDSISTIVLPSPKFRVVSKVKKKGQEIYEMVIGDKEVEFDHKHSRLSGPEYEYDKLEGEDEPSDGR